MLNMFKADESKKSLIAQGWVPTNCLEVVTKALSDVMKNAKIAPVLCIQEPIGIPPTFHRTNKFTSGFQEIVDAYGISTYGEVNPGLYTIITFPFLFAVMFGDFGHGLLMSLFAIYITLNEKKLGKKNWGEVLNNNNLDVGYGIWRKISNFNDGIIFYFYRVDLQ